MTAPTPPATDEDMDLARKGNYGGGIAQWLVARIDAEVAARKAAEERVEQLTSLLKHTSRAHYRNREGFKANRCVPCEQIEEILHGYAPSLQ